MLYFKYSFICNKFCDFTTCDFVNQEYMYIVKCRAWVMKWNYMYNTLFDRSYKNVRDWKA